MSNYLTLENTKDSVQALCVSAVHYFITENSDIGWYWSFQNGFAMAILPIRD